MSISRTENLIASLKERYPELDWKILVACITPCTSCNHQACPEVTRIPAMTQREYTDGLTKQKILTTPVTPPGLIAGCSECGAFWWVM